MEAKGVDPRSPKSRGGKVNVSKIELVPPNPSFLLLSK